MMDNISQKRIWLYGSICSDTVNGKIVGSSQHAEAGSHFPKSGLTPAMQAAIRGDIELLLIENQAFLDAFSS